MKILVTGASGFIGKHLVPMLSKNHNVEAVSRSHTVGNVKWHKIDLSKRDSLCLLRSKYDVVIHLAALTSEGDPMSMFKHNVMATVNLLEYCRKGNMRLIFVSAHNVYGKTCYLPIDEGHPTIPTTNYGVTKLISEQVCKVHHDTYGMNIIILRISSVFGECQSEKKLIPSLIRKALLEEPLVLHRYNNGFQIMDMIYVKDVCRAISAVIKNKRIRFGIYNVASGTGITVKELAEKITSLTGSRSKLKLTKISEDTNHFVYDITKAKKHLGFQPVYSLDTVLSSLINELREII